MSQSFFSRFKLSRRSRGAKRKVSQRRSHGAAFGQANLGLEPLEARMMLSARTLVFHVSGSKQIRWTKGPLLGDVRFDDPAIGPEEIEKFTIDWKDGTPVQDIDRAATPAQHTRHRRRIVSGWPVTWNYEQFTISTPR